MTRSRLGPLAIESRLGDNPSQSSVWRAIHVQLKRAVAVKIFSAPFGGTPEGRSAFATEWDQLKLIKHPAIARCFGGGFEETDAYLAHELIDGDTLAAQIERKGRLSWENVLELAEPLADALEYLHQHKVYHGAIQPDKIVIAGLSPVLLDARLNRFATHYKSNHPVLVHEVAIRCPEALDDPQHLDSKGDLYAFGATLYWALTGQPPITGSSIEEVRGNVVFQIPMSVASQVMDCPVWLDRLVTQLLEKDPVKRPASATAVKKALTEVRKRAMSRSSVAEHASSGFSALQMTDQKGRDEARTLLGRDVVNLDEKEEDEIPDATVWHDKTWVLLATLVIVLAFCGWIAWPASEDSLRSKAEALIAQDTLSASRDAKSVLVLRLLKRFPDGEHAEWARGEVDRINVRLFLNQLDIKIKKDLLIENEGEILHQRAREYLDLGDVAAARDKYSAIVTILGGDEKYKVAVDAAAAQLLKIEKLVQKKSEKEEIIRGRMDDAEKLLRERKTVEARQIWREIIKEYDGVPKLAPLIEQAQRRLEETK